MTETQWLLQNGFDENGNTYCIVGNTYVIKDYLKEQGCKFSPLLKWHADHIVDVASSYKVTKVNFNDIYRWDDILESPCTYSDTADRLARILYPDENCQFEFLGQIRATTL